MKTDLDRAIWTAGRGLCAFALALILAACGGGGGSSATAPSSPSATTPFNPAYPVQPPSVCTGTAPSSTSTVTVQGKVQFERVNPTSTGALDYNNITAEPVRGATVELLSGTCLVVATTQTSATGQYAFSSVPGHISLTVRVRAELKQASGAAQWDTSVSDNTNGNAMYALLSSTFSSGTGTTQNLLAGSGWNKTSLSYANPRAAAPFAILDVFYISQQKVLAVNPNAVFPALHGFWSINNNTSSPGAANDLVVGNIGNSFFRAVPSGNAIVRELYVLGRENADTDEYDSSVVAHEWGHYFQSAFSRDDSMGGDHGGADDRLDRRIAFSEGWGNAWSGIVLNRNTYFDSMNLYQSAGGSIPLNSGYATANPTTVPKGWFREDSVQYILWDLNRQAGFAPIYSALASDNFKTNVALSSIHSFAAAYRSVASSSATSALNSLLSAENISSTSDALGNNETNNAGSTLTLPMYRSLSGTGTVLNGQNLCVTSQFISGKVTNKVGRYVYATFSTSGTRKITITANSSQADPDFEVHSGGKLLGIFDTATSSAESASITLPSGTHVLVIYDYNNLSQTCFSVSIQ